MWANQKLISGIRGNYVAPTMKKHTQQYWPLIRTLLFWVMGFRYTVFIEPAEVGSWQHIFGFALLAMAIWDTYQFMRKAWLEDTPR